MLIIGSHALNYHLGLGRICKDIDVIGTYNEVADYVKSLDGEMKAARPFADGKKYLFVKGNTIVEAEIAWEGSLAEEFLALMDNCDTYASLNGLYMLKMSHRYLKNSPHFLKTWNDIMLMRKHGATIPAELQDFYKRRRAATYNYSHPNLNVAKKDFFDGDGINYIYDHDTIHEAMKHQARPAYAYFKPAKSDVMVDRGMFEGLDHKLQLNSVLEESYVLAIERSQVPFPGRLTPRKSFEIALQKVCTSITSGWWREFAWENHANVDARYSDSYMERFTAGLASGIVKTC